MDRATLETKVLPVDKFVECFVGMLIDIRVEGLETEHVSH